MTLTAAARKLGIQPATAKNYLDRVKEKYRRAAAHVHETRPSQPGP
ncbi:hypothetical protein ACFQY4_25385 [Catellatospora bangladeshensis]